jgi:hypothetical protein
MTQARSRLGFITAAFHGFNATQPILAYLRGKLPPVLLHLTSTSPPKQAVFANSTIIQRSPFNLLSD